LAAHPANAASPMPTVAIAATALNPLLNLIWPFLI
jgi:hypothetical protein